MSAVIQPSDVVFMYQSDRKTYAEYGATVLAWGGRPNAKSLEEAEGVKFFGSVGMVTEFSRYYERFPDSYEQGLCRDIQGQPVKVPWLTDHQHKGIPFWWCCTQQPQFRQYLTERVIDTVKAGAQGVHIDDHMGSAGGLWLGLCFCDRCVDGFPSYLKQLPPLQLESLGIGQPETFNYRDTVKKWIGESNQKRTAPQHPLWNHWTIYQCRAAAAFMQELRETAAKTAGRAMPMGANAGLLWPRHLSDYKTLDLFSAETDHHASNRAFNDLPLFAYRMADAVQRPYAATASGGDWAFVKEQNVPGLVRGWIALSYAAGHNFMAPHRQWCYTPEKGTHWYQGPVDKFAPLYRFVRAHADWLDGFRTHADIAIVLPHRSFMQNPKRWFEIGQELAAKNVSYRLILAGDEIVDRPLSGDELMANPHLLAPTRDGFMPEDAKKLQDYAGKQKLFTTVPEALEGVGPAVKVQATAPVRVLARVKAGAAVVHLLNYDYKPEKDDIQPQLNVKVSLEPAKLGLTRSPTRCDLIRPEGEPLSLKVNDGVVEIPELGLWGILRLKE